jgi:hypothetical protein
VSKNAMSHIILTDDDGSGTTGTILNNDLFDQVQDAVDAALLNVVQTKSGAYTVLVTDDVVICTAALTLTLYAVSTNSGRPLVVANRGTGSVVIDGNASETINGNTTLTIGPGDTAYLRTDGSSWVAAVVMSSQNAALHSQVFG